MTREDPRRGRAFHLLAGVLYLALAVALTWPLVLCPSQALAHDARDPLLNTWLLWWNSREIPFSAAWWSPPFFFPLQGGLALSETLVGLAPLTTPLLRAGASPPLAYNAVFLLSFPLSGLALYLLVFEISRRLDLALVAGLAYGFAPYRAAHLAHLQVLCAFWIPLVFLGLHGFLRTGRRRWLLLFASAYFAQGLSNGYYLLFVSLFVPAWIAWFAWPGRQATRTASIVAAWLGSGLALMAALGPYPRWQAALGFERTPVELDALSLDAFGLVSPPAQLANWALDVGLHQESCVFPGATLPLVVLVALVLLWRRRRRADRRASSGARLAAVSASAAALAALVAAGTALFGPWRLDLAGIVATGAAVRKPLALAFYGLALALALSPALRGAWRRRSPLAFYLLAAGAAFVLALGPSPHAGELRIWDAAPYGALIDLPGFSGLRAPARLTMLAVFGLCCAGALALGRLVPTRAAHRRLWVALVSAGLLWDGWMRPLPLADLPAPFPAQLGEALAAVEPTAVLLELPMGLERDASALYRSIAHGRELVNGYSGYAPSHYQALVSGIDGGDLEVLRVLRRRRSLLVLVDERAPEARGLAALVTGEGSQPLRDAQAGLRPYLLGRLAQPPPEPLGSPIIPERGRVGRGRVVCDLGRTERLGSVVLSFGRAVAALPKRLTVEVATAPPAWTTVWNGPVAGLAMEAALADPRRVPVRLATPGAAGRFVRIRFQGTPAFEGLEFFRPANE